MKVCYWMDGTINNYDIFLFISVRHSVTESISSNVTAAIVIVSVSISWYEFSLFCIQGNN